MSCDKVPPSPQRGGDPQPATKHTQHKFEQCRRRRDSRQVVHSVLFCS